MKIQTMLAQSILPISILGLVALAPRDAIAKPPTLQKIPGTTVELAPPDGFEPSKLFSGFQQQETGASILVTEMPIPKDKAPQVFEQFSSAAALQARGMRLLTSEAITISGSPGKLLLLSQSNQGIMFLKWVVVAVGGDRTLIVNAPFPESESAKLKEPLRQAVIGLTWRTRQPTPPLEGLSFTFVPAGDLQISERVSNVVLLTQNGIKPPIPASQPMLIVGSAYNTVRISDVAKFARMRLKAMPQVRDLAEVSGSIKAIAGHRAFEIVARGYDLKTNTPLTVYQVIIATEQTYYILQGLVPNTKAQKYLPIFRTVADSFVPQS